MLFERKWVTQKVVGGIPIAAKALSKGIPPPLIKLLLERALNLALRDPHLRGELRFIQQRRILIKVTDLDLCFSVGFQNDRFTIIIPCHNADVSVRATFGDFIALIGGTEDPDTLFFCRRLQITGDTELGLALKNFLDRVETKEIFPSLVQCGLLQLAQVFSEIESKKTDRRINDADRSGQISFE
jgi:predicted lipid carrier protein YhbT